MEELLYWYNICGHYNIKKTQKLIKIGGGGGDLEPMIIPKLPGSTSFNIPLCRSCLHGKRRLTSMHNIMSKPTVEYSDVIQEGNILSGDCVNTDQYECRLKGWLPNKRGKEDP